MIIILLKFCDDYDDALDMKTFSAFALVLALGLIGCGGTEAELEQADAGIGDTGIAQADGGGTGGAAGHAATGGASGTGGAPGGAGGLQGSGGAVGAGVGGASGLGGMTGTGGAGGAADFPVCARTGAVRKSTSCGRTLTSQSGVLYLCVICTQGYDLSTLPCVGGELCVSDCNDCD
jgi:hypothetical protein